MGVGVPAMAVRMAARFPMGDVNVPACVVSNVEVDVIAEVVRDVPGSVGDGAH
jgi:hypothetical protein